MANSFTDFLHRKRIFAKAWQQARPEEYQNLERLFTEMGETSFDQHKKFLFNPTRLQFPLPEALVPKPAKKEKPGLKPSGKSTSEGSGKAPLLKKKKLSTASSTSGEGDKKASPPPLKGKLPIKKKSAEGSQKEDKPKPPPLKGEIPLKKKSKDSLDEEETAAPKPPPLKKKLPLKKKGNAESDD